MNSDIMIKSIIEFQKEGKKTAADLNSFLEKLRNQPYMFIGVNKVPHKLIYNSKFCEILSIIQWKTSHSLYHDIKGFHVQL